MNIRGISSITHASLKMECSRFLYHLYYAIIQEILFKLYYYNVSRAYFTPFKITLVFVYRLADYVLLLTNVKCNINIKTKAIFVIFITEC